ncbi:MAG: ABC transporter permease subunit [Clostridia bacterium]|nr:ABC transporter permease subunit [Clostridia bacterium]
MLRTLYKERQLWIISVPIIVWVLIFWYYPMYGLYIAFTKYFPGQDILSSPWVGLDNFILFFRSPDFWNIIRNTLAISGLNILFGFPAPIILALLLTELTGSRFKKVVQTVSYLPYFISWVVLASILFNLLGNDGIVNQILKSIGAVEDSIPFLSSGKNFWWVITGANLWKNVGWNTIIYLSAIAGIDPELYDAGKADGLGRFRAIWYITLPGIRTTLVLLMILSISGILNAGFEQQLLIGNPQTIEYHEVVDTYAYRFGIQLGNYSYATAVGFFKSTIGLVLIFAANRVSKKIFDVSIF